VVWPGDRCIGLSRKANASAMGWAGRAHRGVVADVTQRKRSEDALMRAEKLAIAGRLAASIAHEINNLLSGVEPAFPDWHGRYGRYRARACARRHGPADAGIDDHAADAEVSSPDRNAEGSQAFGDLESVLTLFRSKMADADITLMCGRSTRSMFFACRARHSRFCEPGGERHRRDAAGGRLVIRLRTSRTGATGRRRECG